MARNKHPEQTVQLILETATKLFLQQGYEKTTLQDIINATGLSKGAIYHHFASKEAILITVVNRMGDFNSAVLAEIRDKKGLTGAEKLRQVFRTSVKLSFQGGIIHMMPYLIDNPQFLTLQAKSIFEEAVPYYVLPIVQQGIDDGSIQAEHPEALSEVLLILADIWLHPVLRRSTPEQVRDRCAFFNHFTRQYGFELLEPDLIDTIASFCQP